MNYLLGFLIFILHSFNDRSQLKTAMDNAEKDYTSKFQTLKAYEAVGMGFDKLVEEYTVLLSELENKQWAVSEMKTTGQQTG